MSSAWSWRLVLLSLVTSLCGEAQAVERFGFTNLNRIIPDGDAGGISEVRTVTSTLATVYSVRIKLSVAGEFNGDLYAYLRQVHAAGTNYCVLLNRPGRAPGVLQGDSGDGLEVTFDDSAPNGDIHIYPAVTNVPVGFPLTGDWKPDGRTNDPGSVFASDAPATTLGSFAGVAGSGEWTLFLSDTDSGGTNLLLGWEMELTGAQNPVLAWATPVAITYGTALDGNQLNASAPVAGVLTYSPAAGTVLHAGLGQTLTCVFTPSDTLNYNSVTSHVSIDVLKRALTITADDKSKSYGEPLPVFTASYSGFVNGDDPLALSPPVVLDCAATSTSAVGIYAITPGSAVSPDYTITFVNGTLTVAPRDDFGIVFLTTPATYLRRHQPVKLDAGAKLNHGDHSHFGGGRLTATIISNAAAGDMLTAYHQGTDAGMIGLVGDAVLIGDLPFARLARAAGPASPLVFHLNTNATPAAVQSLVRALAFVTTNIAMTARVVEVTITDGIGSSGFPARKTVVIDRAATIPPDSGELSTLARLPRGNFNGLIARTGDILPERSGYFRLRVQSTLRYSGYFIVGGRRTTFSGQFNENGHAAKLTSRGAFGIELELMPETDQVRGALTSYRAGGWSSELLGHCAGFSRTNQARQLAGAYTLALPGSADPTIAAAGNGYAAVTVSALGNLRLIGRLADGQVWSQGALVSSNGLWPGCASRDRNQGIILGWLSLDGSPAADITGTVTWFKPRSTFYPNGFVTDLGVVGSRFTRIKDGIPPLRWAEGEIQIYAGNLLTPATNQIRLSPRAKLMESDGPIQRLSFVPNLRNGLFTGQFVHPVSRRTTRYYGALLQNRDMGAGYFLGMNQGGLIRLMRATEEP